MGPLTPTLGAFAEQVTSEFFTLDVFYALATVCLLFIVVGVGLIDAGLVRRKNLLDTWIQKIVASFLAGLGMAVVGYAVWQIQFYQALQLEKTIGLRVSEESELKGLDEHYWKLPPSPYEDVPAEHAVHAEAAVGDRV